MLVTDRHGTAGRDLAEVVAEAVMGGVDAVQVREKDLPDQELLAIADAVQRAVDGRARLLVNSRPAVALALGAGLHLAADMEDLPRHGWPLWGRSVHSPEEARDRAMSENPDYLLIGNIFPTSSKPGSPGGGLGLAERTAGAAQPCPVLAIGGIDATNTAAVMAAGAAGIAVRSAILAAPDPRSAAADLREALVAGRPGVRG